jgi:HAE1 family hydrophobic/amphiphilic exporter-1
MSFIGVIMLMGLVAKNAILLLDAARAQEREGVDREEALMAAGRKRLRPILMTTFALIAGMLPVAIGVGEGGEFYRPMAVAIIGGTITSTLLTLLVIPSFYDSIEIARPCAGQVPRRATAALEPRWPSCSRCWRRWPRCCCCAWCGGCWACSAGCAAAPRRAGAPAAEAG